VLRLQYVLGIARKELASDMLVVLLAQLFSVRRYLGLTDSVEARHSGSLGGLELARGNMYAVQVENQVGDIVRTLMSGL
jgi:hypothetical protein